VKWSRWPTTYIIWSETYQLWHTERLDVVPGLTGLWQIAGRAQLEFDDRLRLDIAYVSVPASGLILLSYSNCVGCSSISGPIRQLGYPMIRSMECFHITQRVPDELIVFLVALIALFPISPLNMPFVRRDAGVFLYTGSRILSGYIPYKDIWDNKPPVIFYINALGLAISDGSKWGVWLIEFIMLILGVYISFKLIKNIFGMLPAVLSLCLWMLSFITIVSGGNYATEYTLLIQFACLWLIYESEKRGTYSWRGYLIGLLSGIAFFYKKKHHRYRTGSCSLSVTAHVKDKPMEKDVIRRTAHYFRGNNVNYIDIIF
jgi:hypothetical protein